LRSEILVEKPVLEALPIASRSSIYLSWGMFLASGGEVLLRRIFEAMPEIENLTLRNRWWLACELAEHEEVLAWCRRELPQQSLAVRETMELVLSAAQQLAAVR
jgi:hypothetical protein